MKALSGSILAVTLLLSVATLAEGQEAKAPILHLTFDDGVGMAAKDASGNERDATVKTDAKGEPADVKEIWVKEGKAGGAIRLDGENVYLSLPPIGLGREDKPFTFEAWINGYGHLLTNGDTHSSFARQWMMSFGVNNVKFNYCFGKSQVPGGMWASLEHKQKIKGWTHVAVTYDGEGELAFYLAGKKVGSVVWEAFISADECDSYAVGAWSHNGEWSGLFKGMIDEVKLYDVVLTDARIAEDAAP